VNEHAEVSPIGDLVSYQEGAVVSRMMRYSGKWLQAPATMDDDSMRWV
jgi:hypothetical protein